MIVTGVGKSGLIARKIAATLTSTGTPATFLHPWIERCTATSGSSGGTTWRSCSPRAARPTSSSGCSRIWRGSACGPSRITGDTKSTLARASRVALDAWVREEACPHDLAPTTSTTAALALGDALAVALLERKGFRREDFAALHPGGALGRKLLLRVRDVMEAGAAPIYPPARRCHRW